MWRRAYVEKIRLRRKKANKKKEQKDPVHPSISVLLSAIHPPFCSVSTVFLARPRSKRVELRCRSPRQLLVYPPESALPSWGCDRGWRAGATLRSRSTQEMDGGENKVDEMKVARPPVFVNVHLRKVYGERRRP